MISLAKNIFNDIERIDFHKFEKDFSFIVNDEIYKTNSFVANILSPNVSKMFENNVNLSYYEINTKYEGDFNQIIEYGEMKTINVKEQETQYFENIMKELGKNDEFLRFRKEFHEDISYENVIPRILIKKELNINLDKEVSFLASNFQNIYAKYPEAIFTFDVDIIEQIISNDQFKISNEDVLFDIILKLYMKSKEYSTLFSYVIFINLSKQSIQIFNENFDINDINNSIWEKIYCRLEQDISSESSIAYYKSQEDFFNKRYINYRRHEHIIKHLSEQCHGNVHKNNIVDITSSSIYNNWKAENLVEENNENFGTSDDENSWIQIDFREKKVLFDSYTLKTINDPPNANHLKSWILEVSNDGENYNEIDRQTNCHLLNGSLQSATFKVSCSTPQRFVRLRQNGSTWYNQSRHYIFLNQIEFSGYLYS